METQPPKKRSRWEIIAWVGTALMLFSYLMMSMRRLDPNIVFYSCQLVGQIALLVVSASKRAWQPAVANLAFAIASVVGLIYCFASTG
ncbi:MAG: hypothetical protein IT444_02625 [Phycisphaeraceae bacterium]|nr:hypothetical protein [Phycisphaeraceae bacterium]